MRSSKEGTDASRSGQKEVVTVTHNAYIRELLQEVNAHGKADRHMKLLTIETERRLGTLWDQEECNQFVCSRKEFWEAARDEEMKMALLERAHRRAPPLPRAWRVSWWLCCSS
jgi:hypothetical protein